MARRLYNRNHKKVTGFIAAGKITPHVWRLREADIIEALNAISPSFFLASGFTAVVLLQAH